VKGLLNLGGIYHFGNSFGNPLANSELLVKLREDSLPDCDIIKGDEPILPPR
jgi:hypothetical protein